MLQAENFANGVGNFSGNANVVGDCQFYLDVITRRETVPEDGRGSSAEAD